jgi:hypothetical protein
MRIVILLLVSAAAFAQNRASTYLLNQTSGTARNPASWAMPMVLTRAQNWDLMWMGQAFATRTQQSGPRGEDAFYSANWGMLGGVRTVGSGAFMLRSMLSLEPATVRNQRYPLLFQTGETAHGEPLVDGQHPHEFLMELSAQYVRPIGRNLLTLYYAPVGDAAMGAVAFPHRASAMELPQAALGHHWLDSTHIVTNLATVGLMRGRWRAEASAFRGREPDENRWNIDLGPIDSWSARVTFQPAFRWLLQTSYAQITKPEGEHHPGDVHRTSASLQYTRPRENTAGWSTILAWARNHKTLEGHATNAFLAETLLPLSTRDFVSARLEWSQRDEILHDAGAPHVASFTAGYTRDIASIRSLRVALAFNATAHQIDPVLRPNYGAHPLGANVSLRFRLQSPLQ